METQPLGPVPPPLIKCAGCKKLFYSFLKLDSKNYKTCNECRYKTKIRGQVQRDIIKKLNQSPFF